MPTTTRGYPYPGTSDVPDVPADVQALAEAIDTDMATREAILATLNAQTGTTYTFVLNDAGQLVTASNASAQTYTVPPQASVAWASGTVLRVVNLGAGVVTFAPGSGVTVNNTAATLSQYESATLVRTASNTWTVVKGGGGLPKASVSGTTGSPTIDSATRSPKTVYKWTGAGSVTIDRAGLVELLVDGGGGGPGNGTTEMTGGGGAGGMLYLASVYLEAGTHTVTVGAGGAVGYAGGPSQLGPYYAAGGGNGAHTRNATGGAGGSGGGGGDNNSTGGAGLNGQGNAGGTMSGATPGGGGGGAGGAAPGGTSSARGAGLANSITGSSVTYSQGGKGGGDGTGATASGANIGKGGDAGDAGGSVAGGSGVVVLVIG